MLKSNSKRNSSQRRHLEAGTIVTYTSRSLHEAALPHFERHLRKPCSILEIGRTLGNMIRYGGEWGEKDNFVYRVTEDDGTVLFAYEGRVVRDSDDIIFLMMDICDPASLIDVDSEDVEENADPVNVGVGNQSIH